MSLRRRLMLVSMTTLALGVAALLVVGDVLLDHTVVGVTGRLLESRAQAQIAALRVTATGIAIRQVPDDGALDDRAWILSGGRVLERPATVSPDLNRAAVALGRGGVAATRPGPSDVQLLSRPIRSPGGRVIGAVVVGVSDGPFDHLQRTILIGSLVSTALILLAGALAIRRALDGALGPVSRMTDAAREWGAHDLDRRFDLGAPRDELTGLAMTLDGLLERIASSRRHEQRFAGDVAHELRTPLSVITGRVELALDERVSATDVELRDALGVISVQARLMKATIESLLAVARAEVDPSSGAVDLRRVLDGFAGIAVRLEGCVGLAEGDPEIVHRALAPLVDNARRHARHRVEVELRQVGGRVRAIVRDDGPGFDSALGEGAFEPGRRGRGEPDGGAGLGLALARRLARACGGEVSLGPGPGGCVVLDLPARGQSPCDARAGRD